ncbi:MbtH family NRPS accessory protein [Streptomyces sp. NPDC127079]|uniref:MbtH family NRPS accessory protein n=1 Tax=Streptomyces sp. NPDC127079 TaxID=3347132 RepID=UPI00366940D9
MHQETAETVYDVVINDEDQYSIWENGRPLPDGWRPDGFSGAKEECLRHIDDVWTALRSPEEPAQLGKETTQ